MYIFFEPFLNPFTGCEYITALSVDGSKVSVKSRPSPRVSLLSPGWARSLSQKSGSVRPGPGEKTGPWLRLAVGHRREDPDPVESRDTSDDTGRHIGPVQARPGLREQGTVVSSNLSSVL